VRGNFHAQFLGGCGRVNRPHLPGAGLKQPTTMESISSPTTPAVSRCRWRIHLLFITAYMLVMGLLGLGRRGTNAAMLSRTTGGLLWVCALELLAFGLVFGLACFVSRATRDDLLLRWRGKLKPILWGAGYSVALRLAVALLVIAMAIGLVASHVMTPDSLKEFYSANRPGVETIIDVAAMRNDPVYFWLTLTVVSFAVAGLREELWRSAFLAGMRALWPQHFGSRVGQVLAVMICSMIFGLGHLAMGPLAVCFAGLIGVGLGLIMIFHGSIWPAVVAHGLFDATSMAMLPWAMAHITKIQP
jgi:membrane protease YdiL (CAAX protease family)